MHVQQDQNLDHVVRESGRVTFDLSALRDLFGSGSRRNGCLRGSADEYVPENLVANRRVLHLYKLWSEYLLWLQDNQKDQATKWQRFQ